MSDNEPTQTTEQAVEPQPSSPEKGRGGTVRRILRVVAWLCATPLLLFLLCAALLYLPPVQRWAVGVACERLSEATGMDVHVGDVRLRFPLRLAMHDMTALSHEQGDTLLAAGTLTADVRLRPLLSGCVETGELVLQRLKVNTVDWIDALSVNGRVGELRVGPSRTLLADGTVALDRAVLSDARLCLIMADSVPPDTTLSEPAKWRIRLAEAQLHNVGLDLRLAPQADSMRVAALVGDGRLGGEIDLLHSIYDFHDIDLSESTLAIDLAGGKAAQGFDPSHVCLSHTRLRLPRVRYDSDGNLLARVAELMATERSGLTFTEDTRLVVRMDSVRLAIDSLRLATSASTRLGGLFHMDLNAFADTLAGQFVADLSGTVARADLGALAPDYQQSLASLSPLPLQVVAKAEGNLQDLRIERLHLNLPGQLTLDARGQAADRFVSATTALTLDAPDAEALVKAFVPADVRSAFSLPRQLHLQADLSLGERITAKGSLRTPRGSALFDADYHTKGDRYDLALTADGLEVTQFVPLGQAVNLTGRVTAQGRGFDFLSRSAQATADLRLQAAHYGSYNLSNTSAQLRLQDGQLDCALDTDNPQLATVAQLSGSLQPSPMTIHADLDLAHADLRSMGLYADDFTASGTGSIDFSYDLKQCLDLRADIDRLQLLLDADTLRAERFDLNAATRTDTTYVLLQTGDLDLDLRARENLFAILSRADRLATTAQRQWKARSLDINSLKAFFPTASLRLHAGTANPVAKFLALQDIGYGHFDADLHTTPEAGLLGSAQATAIEASGVRLDTVLFDLRQDSARVVYRTLVAAPDQPNFKAFTATLDGHVATTDADAHLLFFNKQHETGIDLGLSAVVGEEALECSVYPDEPILGYKRFTVNRTNFIRLTKKNRMEANVLLRGVGDSSLIALTANPADTLMQDIHALVRDLNMADILNVVPGMPEMKGLFNLNANYRQTSDRFWVSGETHLDNFVYEGTKVGNVQADFDYMPMPSGLQKVNMEVAYEGQRVATVDGQYDPTEQGHIDTDVRLDSVPLALTAPFIPNQMIVLGGALGGQLHICGSTDNLDIDGQLLPDSLTVTLPQYSVTMRMDDQPIEVENSRVSFNRTALYGATDQTLTLNGWIDMAAITSPDINLSLYGRDFKFVNAPRTPKALLFGNVWGDVFARVNGTPENLKVRGLVKILQNSNMTYVMEDTPLTVDDRLSDIVTFVDFTAPPDTAAAQADRSVTGMDLNLSLIVEDGAKLNCEFSADKQSYVNVRGNGNFAITMTPEGVFTMTGRYTVSEGEMKYTLPVIPLKTFTIAPDSYVEFTGDPMNPTLSFAATEQTRATVTDASGSSRSVLFNAGLEVTGSLEQMQLLFTIEAPEDLSVKNELAGLPKEDKNKLAVGLLCTGMYLSSSNSSGISAGNALNNFLQSEINNIAGKALATTVDVDMGMEQSTRDDGTTRTDYSFKFSKRFFSDRLNVVIGGRVNTDGNRPDNEAGAYIDDVSLEWRLNTSGTRYVRLYHEKNYDNLIEGELTENGASLVLRRKLDRLSELLIWKKED